MHVIISFLFYYPFKNLLVYESVVPVAVEYICRNTNLISRGIMNDQLCVLFSYRGSCSPAGGLLTCALGSVGGAGLVLPLHADGDMRVHHGHDEQHLAVLQLIRCLQNHIHAAYNSGHVSTDTSY